MPSNYIANRWGIRAAFAVTALILAYVGTGIVWLIKHAGSDTPPLQPEKPYLAIMETFMFISAPVFIILIVAVHVLAPDAKKIFSLTAVVFMTGMGIITGCIHFVRLSMLPDEIEQVDIYSQDQQLTPMLALDMLAWTFFYGLALIFAGLIFAGDSLQRNIRLVLLLSGSLCLFGISGPLSGELNLYLTAPAGFTVGTFIGCVLLIKWFRRQSPAAI